ncbi:MAG: NADH-quinone oxidoreductase subunit H [Methanofollis sp.]|uniref:respiratory chain complex I subunit 1 family protein n=1 Tax=Methanofollis sp. TaxID=2052835 RepID=UPI00262CC24F|nr:NADH-quinone oxidoreductase subunit H [Methanofollis sp.]MDD4255622.1 NADH-quinone oxidoreductase subunit H [Methanofollis sp.]
MIEYLIFAVFAGLLLHGIHRKAIARVQGRPGPPVWQEILHVLKFSFKETWIPATASETLFVAVVLIAIGVWSTALFVLLTGGSLLLLFAVYMLHKIVEHGLGLSSGSPYGKFGAIRSVMSAASEIPLFATIAAVYLVTGSLMISDIQAWQAVHGPLLLAVPPAAIALYIVVLAKMHYSPFAVIESKEIVSGNVTEHFGVWRAGLDAAFALKTFVLLYAFILLFMGPMPLLLAAVTMVLLLLSLSFICALTPMLSPFDTVTIQIGVAGLIVVYVLLAGVIL